MAPKKRGLRAGRQGAAAGEGAEPPLSERRQYLHRQHKECSEELQACRQRLEQLRADDRLVDSEAARLHEGNPFSVTYWSRGAQRCTNSTHRRDREGGVDLPQIYRQRAELTSIYRAHEDRLRAHLVNVQALAVQLEQQEQKLQLGIEQQWQQLAQTRALQQDLLKMDVEDRQQLHCARQRVLESEAALRQARQQEAVGALRARIQATSIQADRGPLRPELLPSHRAQALRNQPRQLPDQGELEDTRGLACVHGGASLACLGRYQRSDAGSKLPPLRVSHRPARLVRRSYSPSPPAPVDSDEDEAASGEPEPASRKASEARRWRGKKSTFPAK
ncbi:coiled-coil domain-containing protein 166-like isoform X2 [Cervus canadensis]|uniref:coiled-coil domain-containing protein 166-like isoform X2 n=1 Tax=Cervus canadensis TaxID=1574408 RepID=UPI001CA368F5|nr:coiled-coil domain-containing protein 166-like isoform X2 [Cervus canadensis]